MDLKTYAVFEALNGEDALLKDMMLHQTVSLETAQKAFKDLIDNKEDQEASEMINDYPSYLAKHTKMQLIQKDGDNFQIQGEISDQTLAVLKLLHNVEPKQAAQEAAKTLMSKFAPNIEPEFSNISIFPSDKHDEQNSEDHVETATAVDQKQINEAKKSNESIAKTVESSEAVNVDNQDKDAISKPEVAKSSNVVNAHKHDNTLENVDHQDNTMDDQTAKQVQELNDASDSLDNVANESDDDVISDVLNSTDQVPDGIPDSAMEHNIPDDIPEELPDGVDELPADEVGDPEIFKTGREIDEELKKLDGEIKPVKVIPLKPKLEKPTQQEMNLAKAKVFKDAMKFLRDGIKERQLDKKLNNLHMDKLDVE